MARDYLSWMQSMCEFRKPEELSASYLLKFENETKRRLRNSGRCRNERAVNMQYARIVKMICLLEGEVISKDRLMSALDYKLAMRGLDVVLPDAVE